MARWLLRLNQILILAVVLLLLVGATLYFTRPETVLIEQPTVDEPLPRGSFACKKGAHVVGQPFALRSSPVTVTLPDLREEVLFLGTNMRPDADPLQPTVHLALSGSEESCAAPLGCPVYLVFDRTQPNCYHLSPGNQKTALWIVPRTVHGNTLSLEVAMRTSKGELISMPQHHAHFTLANKQGSATSCSSWQAGDLQVDGGLLARQHARWYGEDLFLAHHGGEEFALSRGRDRIDFGEGAHAYFCFLKLGEYLVWKGGRWCQIEPGEQTKGRPLLHLKAFEDKFMLVEVWDGDGIHHMTLRLPKLKGIWQPSQPKETLRFVAAKTWSQFVMESGNHRLEVEPGDWLLLKEGNWVKLSSIVDIDDYVARTQTGELLVIDGLELRDGRRHLSCHLFNATRTEIQHLEVPLGTVDATARIARPKIATKAPSTELACAVPVEAPEDKKEESHSLITLPKVIRGLLDELSTSQ